MNSANPDTGSLSIEDHPDYPDVLDEVERFAAMTKQQLVDYLYDDSGEGESKQELKTYSRAKLIVRAVDQQFGSTCH